MTLTQMNYIITISETGSLNKAAEALYISQPSLTNAVKELEKELGIIIFNRSGRGVTLTNDGAEFLLHAKELYGQYESILQKYGTGGSYKKKFGVSTQHYSFAVNAFVDVIRQFGVNQYDFTLRETETHEIIEDVSTMKREIGVLYTCPKNEEVIMKMIRQNNLEFKELFVAKPHVFISYHHPLAYKKTLTLKDLEDYPYLSFEQGEYNSFYFSEEVLSTLDRKRNIKVRDRATLFNLLIGLNGYTVSTGIISKELNGETIISVPLLVDEIMKVGTITQKNMILSRYGEAYMEALKKHI